MTIRTCLLISDDPDDPVDFSEALYDISDDTVVVTVSDIYKALDLLRQKRCVPDFILLNTDVAGFEEDRFFDALESDASLNHVKVIAFGDTLTLSHPRVTLTAESDLSFSELKEFLHNAIGGKR